MLRSRSSLRWRRLPTEPFPPEADAPAGAHRTRRWVIGAALGLVAGGAGLSFARYRGLLVQVGEENALAPDLAHRMAQDGTLLLVDIRRPDEWQATGIGEGAHGIDMRRTDFSAALDAVSGGDRTGPVALICARGVRSAALAARLQQSGFARVLDVPEGMLGSRAGPGWLARGLPVRLPAT